MMATRTRTRTTRTSSSPATANWLCRSDGEDDDGAMEPGPTGMRAPRREVCTVSSRHEWATSFGVCLTFATSREQAHLVPSSKTSPSPAAAKWLCRSDDDDNGDDARRDAACRREMDGPRHSMCAQHSRRLVGSLAACRPSFPKPAHGYGYGPGTGSF